MDLLIVFVNDVCLFPKTKKHDIRLCNGRFPGDMQANNVHIIGGNNLDFTIS